MPKNSKKERKTSQKDQISDSEPMVTDFGSRRVSQQNFSKIVALPKMALQNCGQNTTVVNVKLVQDKGERYIKLTPIRTETEVKE